MGAEIKRYLVQEVPPGVIFRLKTKVATIDDLWEALSWTEDSPHRLAHVLDTVNIFHYLAESYELDPIESNLGERALRFHDMGYRFSEQGIITPGEHHFGSMFLASIVDPDERVLGAIKQHVENILPKDTPMWIRLVRDADRVSALGFTGANRLAFYFGFRDSNLQDLSQDQVVKSEIFCTLAPPPTAWEVLSEYHTGGRSEQMTNILTREAPAFWYFCDKVLPYLYDSGNLVGFCNYMRVLDRRFWGQIQYHGEVEYESISGNSWGMYYPKSDYTRAVIDLGDGDKKSPSGMRRHLIEKFKGNILAEVKNSGV